MENLEEKIGGDYEDFIEDINNIKIVIDNICNDCKSHLGQQIAE